MNISDEDLDALIEEQGEYVTDLQCSTNTEDPIGHQLYVESEEQIYAALTELRAWRQTHEGESVASIYFTPFGPVREQ